MPAFWVGNARHCRRGLWCRDPNRRRVPSGPYTFRCAREHATPAVARLSHRLLRPHYAAMSGTAIASLCQSFAAVGRASADVAALFGVADSRSARSAVVAGRRSVRSASLTARSVRPEAGCLPPVGGGWPPSAAGWWFGCSSARKEALLDSVAIGSMDHLRVSPSSQLLSLTEGGPPSSGLTVSPKIISVTVSSRKMIRDWTHSSEYETSDHSPAGSIVHPAARLLLRRNGRRADGGNRP